MLKRLEFSQNGKDESYRSPVPIRIFDLVISGMILLVTLPLLLLIALLIKITSSGPVFSKVECIGRHKKPFQLLKFRCATLKNSAEDTPSEDNPHFTSIGQFLRRTSLNMMPTLINVFRGDMSIVGPRLLPSKYLEFIAPEQQTIFRMRPGIVNPSLSLYWDKPWLYLTGSDREAVYRSQIPQRVRIDSDYFENRTVWKDIQLILKSIFLVAFKRLHDNPISNLRNRHIFLIDVFLLLIIPSIALIIRLEGFDRLAKHFPALLFFTILALLVKLPLFYYTGLYRRYWRFASLDEITLLFFTASLSGAILLFIGLGFNDVLIASHLALPRSIPFIDGVLTFLAIGSARFAIRGLNHWYYQFKGSYVGRRVLIVGAGEAGSMIVREIRNNPKLNLKPVAYVDDDVSKTGRNILGLPVVGTTENISEIVNRHKIEQILVAMPSVSLVTRRRIVDKCKSTGVPTDSLPGVYEILAGYKTISRFPDIDINLLLHRDPIVINQSEVATSLKDSVVLVTGAGGSIGSELCRQIARFQPKQLLLLGHGENSIFEIGLELSHSFPNLIFTQIIADVQNRKKISWVFEKYRPNIVFHAAAHKHVPLMENNVEEAISNNVLGTQNVLSAASQNNVERFVLISTDKAIRPSSIMGSTKRIAELLTMAAAKKTGRPYMAVRFGNVLGSRGSVIPIFQRQIAAGGPVTITHQDMTRYFMTIPEACQLVLQASVLGKGKEVFLLDMGKPVSIRDLAYDLIQLSGLEPERDIKIKYTGIRPGEKLHEELFDSSETYQRTRHQKIFIVESRIEVEEKPLAKDVEELARLVRQMKFQSAKEQIPVLLRKYQSQQFTPPNSNGKNTETETLAYPIKNDMPLS